MAKEKLNAERKQDEQDTTPDHAPEDQAPEQTDAEGQPRAASEGESAPEWRPEAKEERVNLEAGGLTSAEEQERAAAQAYPRRSAQAVFDPAEDEVEPARVGHAATSRSEIGRVIVLDEDYEHDGELYKAGVQQQPVEVADALIAEGVAFEPAGKKRGR